MRLRQIALVARELEPVVADLCAVFDLEVAYRDPGVAEFGLQNAVMPVGEIGRASCRERVSRYV